MMASAVPSTTSSPLRALRHCVAKLTRLPLALSTRSVAVRLSPTCKRGELFWPLSCSVHYQAKKRGMRYSRAAAYHGSTPLLAVPRACPIACCSLLQ